MFVFLLLLVHIHAQQAEKIFLTTVGIEPAILGVLAECFANYIAFQRPFWFHASLVIELMDA